MSTGRSCRWQNCQTIGSISCSCGGMFCIAHIGFHLDSAQGNGHRTTSVLKEFSLEEVSIIKQVQSDFFKNKMDSIRFQRTRKLEKLLARVKNIQKESSMEMLKLINFNSRLNTLLRQIDQKSKDLSLSSNALFSKIMTLKKNQRISARNITQLLEKDYKVTRINETNIRGQNKIEKQIYNFPAMSQGEVELFDVDDIIDAWQCQCKATNPNDHEVCPSAFCIKPGVKGWICNSCTCLNPNNLYICRTCEKAKGSSKDFLPWSCEFCSKINRMSIICKQCRNKNKDHSFRTKTKKIREETNVSADIPMDQKEEPEKNINLKQVSNLSPVNIIPIKSRAEMRPNLSYAICETINLAREYNPRAFSNKNTPQKRSADPLGDLTEEEEKFPIKRPLKYLSLSSKRNIKSRGTSNSPHAKLSIAMNRVDMRPYSMSGTTNLAGTCNPRVKCSKMIEETESHLSPNCRKKTKCESPILKHKKIRPMSIAKPWACPNCRTRNLSTAKTCKRCGYNREFDILFSK